jgi:hypothetical protein
VCSSDLKGMANLTCAKNALPHRWQRHYRDQRRQDRQRNQQGNPRHLSVSP